MEYLKISSDKAYQVSLSFLRTMHEVYGWESLRGLLGSMHLIDGTPSDDALMDDWNEVFASNCMDYNYKNKINEFDKDSVYKIVFLFLWKVMESGVENIHDALQIIDKHTIGKNFEFAWERTIEDIRNGWEFPAYTVTKDGIIFDVHRVSSDPLKR